MSWRELRRSKGRSALIAAMICLPVAVITALVSLLATIDISPQESLTADLGAADVRITGAGRAQVVQSPAGESWTLHSGGPSRKPWAGSEVAASLPAGSRMLPIRTRAEPYRADRWYAAVSITEVDLRDPLTRGMYTLVQGRLPAAAGEVAVSPPMLERGVRVGSTLTVSRKSVPKRVVGVVDPGAAGGGKSLVGFPGGQADNHPEVEWLVDTPRPLLWDDVLALNAKGLAVKSRAVIENPPDVQNSAMVPASYAGIEGTNLVALVAMVVSMVILEVVLLAGPAFAVGLRRRRTELGLIVAQGGDARHLRSIVLADGLVLGALSALAGGVLGIALTPLGLAVIGGLRDARMPSLDVPWGEVGVVVVLGAASAVIAAVLPARQAARMDAAAVLAGRRERPRVRRGWPIFGAVLVVAGIAVTVSGIVFGLLALVGGTLLTQLGFVALAPRLVGLITRLTTRLPLPVRLAGRDAVRHRGRTAPAIAAVMAATAVATAAGIGLSSGFAENRLRYQPSEVPGTLAVQRTDELSAAEWQPIRDLLTSELPGVTPVEYWAASPRENTHVSFERSGRPSPLALPTGDVRLLRHLLGRADPAAEAAFAEGKAVVFQSGMVTGGQAKLAVDTYGDDAEVATRSVSLPAIAVSAGRWLPVQAVLPHAAAEKAGLKPQLDRLLIDPREHQVTEAERTRIDEQLKTVTYLVSAYLERGFAEDFTLPFVLLGGAVALLVLGATFMATGLAAADARPDLAGMFAVGAPARTRRAFVAAQAAIIAVAGVVLGVLSGFVPGLASTWSDGGADGRRYASFLENPGHATPVIDIPWSLLAVIVIGLPLLAALVAGLLARTKVVLARRVA
ncbi:FtsX-like permease family protein [Streptosporangium soli]|nr:ABC transporter permease [Streptosporangium sp. KLBMP 9127]